MKGKMSEIRGRRSGFAKIMLLFLSFVFAILFSSPALADEMTLSWDPNTERDLAGYCVYRADKIGCKTTAWVRIATIPKDVTTYTDVIDEKNYAWMVTAFDEAGGESFPSNMTERYDRTAPGAVQNLRK